MSLNNTVFALETVNPLAANSPLRRVSINKRSDKKNGIERESMIMDLPASVFNFPSDKLEALKPWLDYAWGNAVDGLVIASLKDFDRVGQIPESTHISLGEQFTSQDKIIEALLAFVASENMARTRAASSSRITKSDVEAWLRDSAQHSVMFAVACKKMISEGKANWANPRELEKLQFENNYSKVIIPKIQLLCANTAPADKIADALRLLGYFENTPIADSEMWKGLAARAELLLNKETDLPDDDLGL